MRDERQGDAGGAQVHLVRATQTELRRHGYQSVLHRITDILCVGSVDLFHFSAAVGNQFEEVLPERHKCHPVEAIHIACLGLAHRICKLVPPKGSVDLPIFESDLQVGNWFVASFSRTIVRSRNLVDANH